jgi:hypothetical protein
MRRRDAQLGTVGGESDREDGSATGRHGRSRQPRGRRLPHADRAVGPARGQQRAVGRESQGGSLHGGVGGGQDGDPVLPVRAVAQAGAPGDGVLYLPARRRVWSLPDPGSVRGLRDLALDRAPAASHTLYGTEVPAPVIRSRVITAARIVAVSDPAGQPLDTTPGEIVKRRVLATYFEECGTRRVQGARVTVYARPGTC